MLRKIFLTLILLFPICSSVVNTQAQGTKLFVPIVSENKKWCEEKLQVEFTDPDGNYLDENLIAFSGNPFLVYDFGALHTGTIVTFTVISGKEVSIEVNKFRSPKELAPDNQISVVGKDVQKENWDTNPIVLTWRTQYMIIFNYLSDDNHDCNVQGWIIWDDIF